VFVGDLINRGPDSKAVLNIVADLTTAGSAVVVAGNHELSLLRYLEDGKLVPFAMLGGLATIRSYVGTAEGDVHRQVLEAFPEPHHGLLRGMASFWENEEVIVTHAGLPPDRPQVRDRSTVAQGSFPELFSGTWKGPKTLVCGHYVQRSGKPFFGEGFVCLDTGCGTIGGPLTALLLPEWEVTSSTPDGVRTSAVGG